MAQLLLIPDPRPLERRLGRGFFRRAPRRPGVYVMKDAQDKVLYVGKAKDLKQRLGNYRIANPDRMPRRHLRMVRDVARIEFQFCGTESAALKREAKLLRHLKPKFNRAGVWPGRTRFVAWRVRGEEIELDVVETPEAGWQRFGPMGRSAFQFQRSIARLLWLAVNQTRGIADLPAGWAHGKSMNAVGIRCSEAIEDVSTKLESLFGGGSEQFILWLGARFSERTNQFERCAIQAEMDALTEFMAKHMANQDGVQQLALL
jgi:excinuclease UvrABC nuclease subunit